MDFAMVGPALALGLSCLGMGSLFGGEWSWKQSDNAQPSRHSKTAGQSDIRTGDLPVIDVDVGEIG